MAERVPRFSERLERRKVQEMKFMIIQTYSGVGFDALDPRPEHINLVDISRGLSNQCRFNGQVKAFYSVAEHCCLGVQLAAVFGREAQRAWLLHDAAEAYLGDLVSPIKNSTVGAEFAAIEGHVLTAIGDKYGVDFVKYSAEIKRVDVMMLAIEREQLIPKVVGQWPEMPDLPALPWSIRADHPTRARDDFMAMAGELGLSDG
jgi:hypothetical protein